MRALIVLTLAVLAAGCSSFTRTLTEEDLQRGLESRFPIERGNWLGTMRLWNPQLQLSDTQPNRVGLAFSLQASAFGLPVLRGRSRLDGELDFRRDTGEIFVRNVSVRELDVQGMAAAQEIALRGFVELACEAALSRTPVYRLDIRRGYRLESIEVRDGKLTIGVRRQRRSELARHGDTIGRSSRPSSSPLSGP